MNITTEIDKPIIALVHFKNEEVVIQAGGRQIYYQVTLYPSMEEMTQLSPKCDYIRFGDVRGDEITGWQPCDNIMIDEVLFEYDSMQNVPFTNQVEVKGKAPELTITMVEFDETKEASA